MRGVRFLALISCLYSWPIFLVVDAWLVPRFIQHEDPGAAALTATLGHMIAMAGPGLAAIVLWRWFHKEPMPRWEWSRLRHYALGATAMLALWTAPGLIGLATVDTFRLRSPIEPFAWAVIGTSFSVGWLAGLGEEGGWTAYLLPRLAPHIGKSRALVLAGAIRGWWHWPVLVGPLVWQFTTGEQSLALLLGLSVVFMFQLIVSNALFGSLFGWVWYKTESLPLMGWLHQWFDATRDVTSLLIVGFGSSVWFKVLWGIPFYLVAGVVLMQVARGEGANLWTLAPPLGGKAR